VTSPGQKREPGLVVAHNNGFAVLTLDLGALVRSATHAQALGKILPPRSLGVSRKLEQIVRANGFLPLSVGFKEAPRRGQRRLSRAPLLPHHI